MTMDRCRHGIPCDPTGPFDLSQCRPCWVAGGGDKRLPARQPADCSHLGDRVDRPGQVREWRACGHPDKPLGPLVCKCKGCGLGCPGYTP